MFEDQGEVFRRSRSSWGHLGKKGEFEGRMAERGFGGKESGVLSEHERLGGILVAEKEQFGEQGGILGVRSGGSIALVTSSVPCTGCDITGRDCACHRAMR